MTDKGLRVGVWGVGDGVEMGMGLNLGLGCGTFSDDEGTRQSDAVQLALGNRLWEWG